MARGEGSGWHHEPRRHHDAAMIGKRPRRSCNPGAPPGLSRERDRHEFYRWNRAEETKDVKKMIRQVYGIDARVTQGKGTAFNWIDVELKGDIPRSKEDLIRRDILKLTGRDRFYDDDPDRDRSDISITAPDRVYPPDPWTLPRGP